MTDDGSPRPGAALDDLRARIVALDAEVGRLTAQRQYLVDEYERHRFAMMGWPPPGLPTPVPGPVPRQEWSGARVRALLLWLGAALLGLSALTFTAVAWSRLGDGGRTLLLLGATAVVTALAVGLRRSLPATAEAFAGLAVVLVLVDCYAARRAGLAAGLSWQVWWAVGTAGAAGFAAALGVLVGRRTTRLAVTALLPVSAELLIGRLAGPEWVAALACAALAAALVGVLTWSAPRLYPENRAVLGLHAAGCWAVGAVLAATAAGAAGTVATAAPAALSFAVLAAAPALARRPARDESVRNMLGVLVCAAPAAAVLTLARPALDGDGLLAAAVLAGGATLLASTVLPGQWRIPAGLAGGLVALPGTLWAVLQATPAVLGPLGWFGDAWTGSLGSVAREVSEGPHSGPFVGSWAAVGILGLIAAAGFALGIRRRSMLGIATAAIALAAALAPLNGDTTVRTALVATGVACCLALVAAALVDREQPGAGWALLPGASIAALPTAGWSAVSAAASVWTLAGTAAAGVAAAVLARPGIGREVYSALAGALLVAFAGVATSAAGAGPAAGGFAASVTAGALLLIGVYRMHSRTGLVLEITAAVAACCDALVAAQSTTWLAGSLTTLAPVAAVAAVSPQRRRLYGPVAGALALGAVWAWLAAGHVHVVEAYTAPAAAVALGAGILTWRRGPGRSWLTLGPALLLGIGPTLLIGIAEDDTVRLIAAAALSLAAVVAGAVLRLQAPLILGAAALLALALDQWGAEILRMPRWITVGIAGVLLMWIGATFERRRRDWRRASENIGRFG